MTVRIEKEDGSRITARGGKWARQIDEKAAAMRKARKRGTAETCKEDAEGGKGQRRSAEGVVFERQQTCELWNVWTVRQIAEKWLNDWLRLRPNPAWWKLMAALDREGRRDHNKRSYLSVEWWRWSQADNASKTVEKQLHRVVKSHSQLS